MTKICGETWVTSCLGIHSADIYLAPAVCPAHPSSGDAVVDDAPALGSVAPGQAGGQALGRGREGGGERVCAARVDV